LGWISPTRRSSSPKKGSSPTIDLFTSGLPLATLPDTHSRSDRIPAFLIGLTSLLMSAGCVSSVQIMKFDPVSNRDDYATFEMDLDTNLSEEQYHAYNVWLQYLVLDLDVPEIAALDPQFFYRDSKGDISGYLSRCSELLSEDRYWSIDYMKDMPEDGHPPPADRYPRGGFRLVSTEGPRHRYRVWMPRRGYYASKLFQQYELEKGGHYVILVQLSGRKVYSWARLISQCTGILFEPKD